MVATKADYYNALAHTVKEPVFNFQNIWDYPPSFHFLYTAVAHRPVKSLFENLIRTIWSADGFELNSTTMKKIQNASTTSPSSFTWVS